jgi:hypothetical protein
MMLSRVLLRMPIAAAIIVLVMPFGTTNAQTVAGSVVGASGQTGVQRAGQRLQLTIGAPVYVGDTVEAGADGKLKLRMSDGSILALAPSSNLRIDTYLVDAIGQRQAAGLSVGQGLLRAVTAPVNRPASFEIDTAAGTAAVRSTDWFVDALPGQEQVSVLNGSVALASRATGRAVTIPPSSTSRLIAGRDPEPPRPLTPGEISSLLSRTEGAAPGYPPAPPPPGYYPPTFPGGIIVVPGGGGRGGDRGGGDRGGRGGREPGSRDTGTREPSGSPSSR